MSFSLLRYACALSLLFSPFALGQSPEQNPALSQQRLNEPQLAVAWSPAGDRVVCSGQNRAIRQFDPLGKDLEPLRNGPGGWSAEFSAQGKQIAVCGLDRCIRLWDSASGTEMRALEGHLSTAWVAIFLPDGQRLISAGEDGTIRVWHAAEGKEIAQFVGHPGPIWCMALTRDGRTLATGGSDGVVRLWDTATGRIRRSCEFNHAGGVWPLRFSPDGRTLASAGWQDGKINLWETATGKQRRQVPHPTGAKALVFAHDGCTLLTAGNDAVIRFWDLRSGQELAPLEGHRGVVNGIAISPDGAILASASADCTFRLWNLAGRTRSVSAGTAPAKQVEASWAALRCDSGTAAFDAMGTLALCPEQTLRLFRERLAPAPSPDVQRISLLIDKTNDSKYAVRQAASAELERLGAQAEPHLLRAVNNFSPPETRRRAEKALEKVQNGCLNGEALRAIRSVEILERIGTDAARELLERLAGGAAEAPLTQHAQAALQRTCRK